MQEMTVSNQTNDSKKDFAGQIIVHVVSVVEYIPYHLKYK